MQLYISIADFMPKDVKLFLLDKISATKKNSNEEK